MMPCTCQSPNPLVRDGTSQASRALPALEPTWAPVDGRELAAYLEYLRRYARRLQYYEPTNQPQGDWAPFIERDVSSAAAAVASRNAERERRQVLALAGAVWNNGGQEPLEGQEPFRALFDALFGLALWVDAGAVPGPEGLLFPEVLRQEVRGNLRAELELLIGLYKAAREQRLFASPPDTAERVLEVGLSADWWLRPGVTSWAGYVEGVRARTEALGAPGAAPEDRRLRALEELRPLLESFPRVLARMAEAAAEDLRKTLTHWPKHEPPMALLLTFLHLFRYALASLDGLTARHLEYYYQEVLRLRPRGAQADRVFVTFELARHLESHVLPASTVLLGGKDAQGKELRYALEEELRLDQTSVGPFLTLHRTGEGRLTAVPIASSTDGTGIPLPKDMPGWRALGGDDHPEASIGFALSSPILLLSGGSRGITVKLTLGRTSLPRDVLKQQDARLFRVQLTTPKGWHELKTGELTESLLGENGLQLVLVLAPEDPPVSGYQRELHGGALETRWPVCRFFLDQRTAPYSTFERLTLLGASIDVKVEGLRQLLVETAAGEVDPAKPFTPFGPQPLPGASFTVRCPELATKRLTEVELKLDWLEPSPELAGQAPLDALLQRIYREYALQSSPGPVDKTTFQVELALGSGRTLERQLGERCLFEEAFNIPSLEKLYPARGTIDSLRFRLSKPLHGFGHRLYPCLHTEKVLKFVRTDGLNEPALPSPPLTPTLAGLSLGYCAATTFSPPASGTLAVAEERFFHLHPFGETRETVGEDTFLLPSYPNEGELYIGLTNTRPRQRLSLLFHVESGSANPQLAAAEVQWACLGQGQRFLSLRGEALGDGTNGLVQSGLVRVVLPPEATSDGTRLPAGRYWLRVSAPEGAEATSRLIAVWPRAARATLLAPGQHPAHLAHPLPSGTLHKLERRQAGIKSIHQPVDSFDGRAPEAPLPFARRVSERLRHKRRALTPHDYEALVLEAFPSLYKVKCLNHTRPDKAGDRELAPGSVTLVTLPLLIGRKGDELLTPYTSQATLTAVKTFLQPLVGRFVRVYVENPLFEHVRLTFRVRFKPGNDPALGISRLTQELKAFLSPWAYEEGRDIVFGGTLHRSTLLHFVERRPFVDYVADFRMRSLDGASTAWDEETIVARTSRSILVSALEHRITSIGEGGA